MDQEQQYEEITAMQLGSFQHFVGLIHEMHRKQPLHKDITEASRLVDSITGIVEKALKPKDKPQGAESKETS